MSGKRVFSMFFRLHIVQMTLLFAYLTISGAIDPHEPSDPNQQQQPPPNPPPSNSSGPQPKPHDAAAPQRYSAVDGPDDQLPYFFIFQLPGLIAEEPTWSEWSQWSPCGVKCGGAPGKSVRRRHCQRAVESECKGESTQWKTCKVVPCSPKEKPLEPSVVPEEKKTEDSTVVVAPVEGGKQVESGKVEAIVAVERHGGEAAVARKTGGADYEKKPDAEEQRYGISAGDIRQWVFCLNTCPYKVQLRRRWCYLGEYCLGAAREIRVCGSAAHGALGACGIVNTTDMQEFGEPRNQSSPWTDPHIGWSHWTPWVTCEVDCDYHIQTVNWSTPCLSPTGLALTNCHGQYELVRVCRKQFEFSASTSPVACGQVENFEHWTMVDDTTVEKPRYFFPSSNRFIHAIVLFVLFTPPIVLLLYWLVSRARKPRYESLPSAAPNGDSAVDANGHPTISADVTSALGPNHLTIETDPNAWKTV